MGEQRKFNYALKPMSKPDFVRIMTTDLPEVPAYFSRDAEINRTGASPLDELPQVAALSPEEVDRLRAEGRTLLDVRGSAAFGAGHIQGSINIGLGGQFASWAGSLVSPETRIVVIAEDEDGVREAAIRLARVGLETLDGFLAGGIYSWAKAGRETVETPQMPVDELKARIEEDARLQIVDVRRPGEYAGGHVPGATNVQLADLEKEHGRLDPSRPTVVICGSGYRSSAATSVLEKLGFGDLYNVVGGTSAWTAAEYAVTTA